MRHPSSKSFLAAAGLLGLACVATVESRADLLYDQNVTNHVIVGTGIGNGGFTVDRNETLGLELGLRARQRFPAADVFNSNGDGVYVFDSTVLGPGQPNTWSIFNFDFSVNTDFNGAGGGSSIADYNYMLYIDYDPTAGVGSVVSFDPFNQPYVDHAFGDNATLQSAGTVAADPGQYATLLTSSNLAQQSWNMGFFGSSTDGFSNGGGDQIYNIWLHAYDQGTGDLVGRTYITVSNDPLQTPIVPVPEPSSTLLLSMLMSAGLLSHRRRRRVAAA